MLDTRSFDVRLADGQRSTVRVVGNADASTWTAFADGCGEAVGVARLVPRTSGGSADVTVAVAPRFRRRGLGKILFDTLVLSALERGFERVVAQVRADSWIGEKLRGRAGAVTRARTSSELNLEVPIVEEPRTLLTSGPLPTLARREPAE